MWHFLFLILWISLYLVPIDILCIYFTVFPHLCIAWFRTRCWQWHLHMTHTSSSLSSSKGLHNHCHLHKPVFTILLYLVNQCLCHIPSFSQQAITIFLVLCKYWKVGGYDISTSPLVTIAWCIYFPVPWVFYNNFIWLLLLW